MKIEFDKKKSAEALSGFVQSTVDFSKKAAADAKDGVAAMVEKSKADSYARRMKKFNPLFPDQYHDANFKLPNIISIVDDAVRRNVDVCEGAIGWLSKDSGVEVLHLYDEFVEFSGIQFIPTVTCDATYCVDSFDHNRYIRTDCVFQKAHEERMAELKQIAYCLGAKKCSIEISESVQNSQVQDRSASFGKKLTFSKVAISAKQDSSQSSDNRRSGKIEVEFEGSIVPQRPELKWFAHDDTINRLIDMRCNEQRTIKTETLELAGSSSATMSHKTACSIDSAIGKGSVYMQNQATREHQNRLLFHIEF
ncbi:MAG: hypothetical protein IKU57_02920 [Oscillospiraceae bacterium]|nr:hypothetical protein [Oscillospiraceae bacterium]